MDIGKAIKTHLLFDKALQEANELKLRNKDKNEYLKTFAKKLKKRKIKRKMAKKSRKLNRQ